MTFLLHRFLNGKLKFDLTRKGTKLECSNLIDFSKKSYLQLKNLLAACSQILIIYFLVIVSNKKYMQKSIKLIFLAGSSICEKTKRKKLQFTRLLLAKNTTWVCLPTNRNSLPCSCSAFYLLDEVTKRKLGAATYITVDVATAASQIGRCITQQIGHIIILFHDWLW